MKKTDSIRIIQCDICNRNVPDMGLNASSRIYKTMMDNCLCPECAFWKNIIEERYGNILTISATSYWVLSFQNDPPPGAILGNNGRCMYFITTDGVPIKSNDVWLIGKAPKQFASDFPDNAYITNVKAYNRIVKYKDPCNNYECPDRYRCFFYNWKDEVVYAPLPREYTPGSTMCEKFLPLRWIENYDYTK